MLAKEVDVTSYGHIVDLTHFDAGSQSVVAYATVNGNILGYNIYEAH